MHKETMKINGTVVNFKVTNLGYNFGDPIRNGTVVEISNEERFCRPSDGVAGKVGLYAYHEKHKAFAAAAKAYLASLFPGMEMRYYFPDIPGEDGKMPSPPVLFMAGIGPSEDGQTLYIDSAMDSYQYPRFLLVMKRWSRVWRYWTSHNICKEEGVKFLFDEIRGSGIPEVYKFKNPCGNVVIRVQDADLDSRVEDKEYFEKLFELIDQLKGE